MTTLTGNIVNRVDKLPKLGNYAQALQPVFEAISNSRYAIFDRLDDNAVKLGKITVLIQNIRSPAKINISVEDNGIGLDDTRFDAFCIVDTDYKKAKGGKGVGRLFWLDAFKEIVVSSRHGIEDNERTDFRFTLRDVDQIEEIDGRAPRPDIGTTVSFLGLRDNEYLRNFPKKR
jgi:signal transduction histidine kinase